MSDNNIEVVRSWGPSIGFILLLLLLAFAGEPDMWDALIYRLMECR